MFDIGFSELVMIGIVALIVVGPEKLPELVRTVLIYFRKIRSGYQSVRDDVERELNLDGIKNELSDTKTNLKNVVGYDELHASLDELKKQSEEVLSEDGYQPHEFMNKDNEDDSGLPEPDEYEDTGVEPDMVDSYSDTDAELIDDVGSDSDLTDSDKNTNLHSDLAESADSRDSKEKSNS